MRRLRNTALALAVASCFVGQAHAADELKLVVFRDGAPGRSLSASVDGGSSVALNANGAAVLDLPSGNHTVRILAGNQLLHSFRVQAAPGQKVDAVATLAANSLASVQLDPYFDTESVAQAAAARTGALVAVVTRAGSPLPSATVTVRGRAETASTDAQGRFRLQLPRGSYLISVSHPQLGVAPLTRLVRVVAGVELAEVFAFDTVAAGPAAGTTSVASGAPAATAAPAAAGTQVVIATRRLPQVRGLDEQFVSGIVDTIDAAEISRYGGSDVAASVLNVPSITVQDSRYLFIRGLGDRYVTTTLNGATLPSTDPSRRTVPLDLFPSNLVAQLAVRKTFTPEMPGESTGGSLSITTQNLPPRIGGKFSAALGANLGLTGQSIYADSVRGDWDYFGVDDGARRENGLLPLIGTALSYSDEFSANARNELLQVGGLLLQDGWDWRRTRAAPKLSLSGSYGNLLDLDGGGRLGLFGAANFSNSTAQRERGISRTYGSNGQVLDDFVFVEHGTQVDASALAALGLRLGQHSLGAITLLSRNTESAVRVSEGFDGDELLPSYRYSMQWTERQFVSQQFEGSHKLGETLAKWQLTGSQALRYSPDRREVRFDLRGGDGLYNLSVPGLLRRFDELTDNNLDISTDWESSLGPGKLQYGAQLIRRDRESESRSFGYQGGLLLNTSAPNRRVNDVVNARTITGNTATGYAYLNETLASDSYEAELRQYAGYLAYDVLLGDFEVVAGARYEHYKQSTQTFGLQGDQLAVRSLIDEGALLPSVSLNWLIDDAQQLRLGLSRTVARPDFKETSNATFYDTEFDLRVRGNPLLKPSKINNFDLRYERYGPGGQNSSVALFFKDLRDPIERVVQAASGTAGNSRTYQNASKARIYGIEVEGRRDFALGADLSRSVFVALNLSLIKSEVVLQDGGKRDLQGQPGYTTNLIVGFDHIPSGQELTLLLNQNGKSIQDVGVNDLPDVLEEPRLSLNLNYRWRFAKGLEFSAKATNLLNSEVKFSQGGQIFQQYRRGTEVEARLEWTF